MSTQQQFLKWLRRKDKTFSENLQFAIKAWKSSEFTLSSKYDIILKWVAEESMNLDDGELPITEYTELLKLRAQPAQVSLESKRNFVEAILKLTSNATTGNSIFPELLYKLIGLDWMQDILRMDYVLTARMYRMLLSSYEMYINENELKDTAKETDFVAGTLNLLKEQLKNSGDLKDWIEAYDKQIVEPLTQVILVLHTKHNIDFFDEVRDLERTLREGRENLVSELLELPMHSAMFTLECAIANRRMDDNLLLEVFDKIFVPYDEKISPSPFLLRVSFVLDILRKHNVLLNFEISSASASAMSYLGARIHEYVKEYKDELLREVLMLLCVVLRLNPLILERYVFEITAWMIVAPKDLSDGGQTLALFQEYLKLLLDMFRRLSRAEKFVANLLKALKEWLSKNELRPTSISPKKLLKRKLKQTIALPNKQAKMEDGSGVFINFISDTYTELLFHDFFKQMQTMKNTISSNKLKNSFIYLYFAWPSSTIGMAFSSLITSLVSKASLTIWKTLLYALKEQLSVLSNDSLNSENSHFRLDFHSALLCQFLAGARPTEQYEKYVSEFKELRIFTKEVLSIFGQVLLERPFNKRTVNAFLECSQSFANFELLLAYYKPDGLQDESLEAKSIVSNLHGFLNEQQWSTIKERIINSGNKDCLLLYDLINFQLTEAKKLLENTTHSRFSLGKEPSKISDILESSTNQNWILSQLNRDEKIELIKQNIQDMSIVSDSFLVYVNQNAQMVELVGYMILENLCREFANNCKSSLLANIYYQVFASTNPCTILDHQEFDKAIKTTVGVIVKSSLNFKVKKIPSELIGQVLKLLSRLPLGHLRRQTKSMLFTILVACYQDLKMSQSDSEAEELFNCLTDLLHFGQQIPIFRYFEMTEILQLLPIADCWDFYKFLFSTIKNEEKGTEEFLRSLEQLLSNSLRTIGDLSSEERRLLVLAIESLNALSGQIGRRIHKHLYAYFKIYGDFIYKHFENENNTKKDKKFVEKTLAGFAPFIKAVLAIATSTKNKNKSEKDDECNEENSKILKPLDETLRRICKIYIGHSMNYRNPHAIQLTQVALKNRKILHLDLDEIELVLNTYWRQLNAEIYQNVKNLHEISSENVEIAPVPSIMDKISETLVRMIIENKTNEDFLLTLKNMSTNMIDEQNFMNVIDLLTLVAKSSFSTIKGAIFNEQFKQITGSIILRVRKNDQHRFTNEALIRKMLDCQLACVENRTIPITPDTLDTILGLLIEINIKKFPITDADLTDFYSLHNIMTSLCSSIIKHRHVLLMDRVAQFLHIFKDLLQAIVLYKCDRQKDTPLNPKELNDLAELALKLEILMHAIATHKTDFKRVSPFVLMFTINLMVSGKRPTTLYPKIKTHIEAICYSLIGISDHRVGRFILRCSNEAARQAYELLVKDHEKYHKFKGKV